MGSRQLPEVVLQWSSLARLKSWAQNMKRIIFWETSSLPLTIPLTKTEPHRTCVRQSVSRNLSCCPWDRTVPVMCKSSVDDVFTRSFLVGRITEVNKNREEEDNGCKEKGLSCVPRILRFKSN